MATPFIAEIRMFGFNFPPRFNALCNGQSLPIAQNQALFSLLGTTYGGNGVTTFNLPNLQGRTPLHFNGTFPLGQSGGEENHTLTGAEMPQHTHMVNASPNANTVTGANNNYLSTFATETAYAAANTANGNLANQTNNTGANQGHNNLQPYSVTNMCIALSGIFPSRN
jgi:microcystin-dependent protein